MNILKAIIKNPFYVKPKSWSPEDTTGQGSPNTPSISLCLAAGPGETWSPRLGQSVWKTLDESVAYVRLSQQLLLF